MKQIIVKIIKIIIKVLNVLNVDNNENYIVYINIYMNSDFYFKIYYLLYKKFKYKCYDKNIIIDKYKCTYRYYE
jgi:hypothetical protein